MRGVRALTLLAIAAVLGCGTPENKYPAKITRAQCKFMQRCDTARFYYNFDGLNECIEVQRELWDNIADDYEGCNYNRKNARKCLKGLREGCKKIGRDYDGLYELCFEVYDCADDVDDDTSGVVPL